MGDEPFEVFVRNYYESHKLGIATSGSSRQLAEDLCQCDLSARFKNEFMRSETSAAGIALP